MKPTDDTLALVAFLLGRSWISSDELRHGVGRLGFDMPSSQWTTSRLTAMCKESAPRFERREPWDVGYHEYRVTSWAATGLGNQWKGFVTRGDHPTPKPEHLRLTPEPDTSSLTEEES